MTVTQQIKDLKMDEKEKEQREIVASVFSASNCKYGQFMPQQYVSIFLDELFENYDVEIVKKELK